MSILIANDQKIDNLLASYQATEQIIHEGSDQHLDIILELQGSIKKLIQLSFDVNEVIESSFNSLTEDEARIIVVKLTQGLGFASQFSNFLRRLHPTIGIGIESLRRELNLETQQMHEFVQDLIKYKINQPDAIRELLTDLQ
jgi:hypothetical protein